MPSLAQARRGLALGAIAGLGVYRPPADAQPARRVTGADLTGVAYRVQPDQGISTPALAAGAARAALGVAHVLTSDIEMIIVGTTTPDVLWPTTACLVQTELKLPMVASFDLYAAETSVLSALNVGLRYVAAGARAVLLIGAESDNQLVDLPGQGGRVHSRAAAAMLLTPAGDEGGVLSTTAGGAAQPDGNGDAQDRTLLRGLTEADAECLQKAHLAISEIDLVIGEQSAPEITQAWSRLAGCRHRDRRHHLAGPHHPRNLGGGQGWSIRRAPGAGVRSDRDAEPGRERSRGFQAGGPARPQRGASHVTIRPVRDGGHPRGSRGLGTPDHRGEPRPGRRHRGERHRGSGADRGGADRPQGTGTLPHQPLHRADDD